MKPIKKYWWVPVILLVVPLLLNFLLLIPTSFKVVGTDTDWLSFWGGYLGAILSAMVAFYVLSKQLAQNQEQNEINRTLNKEENDANRNLQVQIMEYQIGLNNINQFKEACLCCHKAFSYNSLCYIANMPHTDKRAIMSEIMDLMESAASAKRKVDMVEFIPTQSAKDFLCLNCKIYHSYTTTLLDLETLVAYLNMDDISAFNGLTSDSHASDLLKPIISKHLPDLTSLGANKSIEIMINERLNLVNPNDIEKLMEKAFSFIQEEQNRLSIPHKNKTVHNVNE